eukprot:6022959-Prorocentrum_lima.AAC.1
MHVARAHHARPAGTTRPEGRGGRGDHHARPHRPAAGRVDGGGHFLCGSSTASRAPATAT